MKRVCLHCGKRIIGGNKRQLYDTDYCKQAAARSRRNVRRASLDQWEVAGLAKIYEMVNLPESEVEAFVIMFVGCHKRDQWAHKMGQLVYLLQAVKELNQRE